MVLLVPLFPSAPALSVVKHVVKEPFLTRRGTTAIACSEGLFFMFRFGVLYLCRGREARGFFESGVSIFNTPIQRIQPGERRSYLTCSGPTKACSCALHSSVIVIAWIQLEHCVNSLGLIEGLNLFHVLPDVPQNRVPGLTLLVSQGKVHVVRPTLWLVRKNVLLYSGKARENRTGCLHGKIDPSGRWHTAQTTQPESTQRSLANEGLCYSPFLHLE